MGMAIELEPNCAEFHAGYGHALWKTGKSSHYTIYGWNESVAEKHFKIAACLDPLCVAFKVGAVHCVKRFSSDIDFNHVVFAYWNRQLPDDLKGLLYSAYEADSENPAVHELMALFKTRRSDQIFHLEKAYASRKKLPNFDRARVCFQLANILAPDVTNRKRVRDLREETLFLFPNTHHNYAILTPGFRRLLRKTKPEAITLMETHSKRERGWFKIL